MNPIIVVKYEMKAYSFLNKQFTLFTCSYSMVSAWPAKVLHSLAFIHRNNEERNIQCAHYNYSVVLDANEYCSYRLFNV